MNNSSTSSILFLFDELYKNINKAQLTVFSSLWNSLLLFLSENLFFITGILLLIIIIALIKAIWGKWGMFGSVLYNYLYFGILFIVGLIFGSSIFANLFIDILLILLYIVCYFLVGGILAKFGFIRRR